ncbi:MAG: hypothetical protein ACRD68_16300, partial [Pyrinomonadaceae bacterium]
MRKSGVRVSRFFAVCALAGGALTAGAQVYGQTAESPAAATQTSAANAPRRVVGEVTAVDAAARRVTVRTSAGASVTISLDEKAELLRTRPGVTTLDGATAVTLADVQIGDRVLARELAAGAQQIVTARQLVVMTKADIAEKQEREREEWRRRGVVGTVSAVNPETKEITLQLRSFAGPQAITVAAGGERIKIRRYAPDSVRFGDAKPGTLGEIKVGDQLRAKGERSADGARFAAEEIVSG